ELVPSSEMKSPVTGRQAPPRRRSRMIMSAAARAACVVSISRSCSRMRSLLATNMPDVAATASPMSMMPMRSSTAVKPASEAADFSIDRVDRDILLAQRILPAHIDGDGLETVRRGVVVDGRLDRERNAADGLGLRPRDHVV